MCGCTSAADAALAIEAGADAIGVIFAPSPRRITVRDAQTIAAEIPPYVSVVGVFVDPSLDELIVATSAIPRMQVQFSGHESPELCRRAGVPYLKVFHVDPAGEWERDVDAYDGVAMLDTASDVAGGSGRTFAWERARSLARRRATIVAGGLTPENVADCVRTVRPFAVDVRSGVERSGRKDPEKMRAFVRAVREADAEA